MQLHLGSQPFGHLNDHIFWLPSLIKPLDTPNQRENQKQGIEQNQNTKSKQIHTQKWEKGRWRLQKSNISLIKWKTKRTSQKPSIKWFIIQIGVDWLINVSQLNNELILEKCKTKLKKFRTVTYILWWQNVGQRNALATFQSTIDEIWGLL